ncbi:hypothetical protein [Absidia glauca]|uniref:Uncharacterized protein n=1 Tax=Absidia glauca TaxID=4829 RepID=A0A168RIJ4_ABSGL|nr:hypothetical protein [Absidia glauca]
MDNLPIPKCAVPTAATNTNTITLPVFAASPAKIMGNVGMQSITSWFPAFAMAGGASSQRYVGTVELRRSMDDAAMEIQPIKAASVVATVKGTINALVSNRFAIRKGGAVES